jgi:hypothetical protein
MPEFEEIIKKSTAARAKPEATEGRRQPGAAGKPSERSGPLLNPWTLHPTQLIGHQGAR